MPNAEAVHTTSRRAMFALVGSTALATCTGPAPAPAFAAPSGLHPDAELLRLSAEFCALERQNRATLERISDSRTPEGEALDAAVKRTYARQQELADAIADRPAATLDGYRAIARALAAWEGADELNRYGCTGGTLTEALVLGLVGEELDEEDEPVFVPAPAVARSLPPDPDAELIALCAECTTLHRALIQHGSKDDDFGIGTPESRAHRRGAYPMVSRLHALQDEIAGTVPRTPAGLRAMADVARRSLVADGDAAEADLMQEETRLAWAVCAAVAGRAAA